MPKTSAIAVALATAFSTLLAQPADQGLQVPAEVYAMERKDALQLWLATTVQHRPGAADDAAALAARWTAADFERLLPRLIYYLDIVRAQETRTRTCEQMRCQSCSACKVSSDERKRLLDETQSEISTTEEKLIRDLPRPDRLNNLILRGAILHADAEMFFRRRTSAPEATTPSATFSRRPTTWSILRAPEEIVISPTSQRT